MTARTRRRLDCLAAKTFVGRKRGSEGRREGRGREGGKGRRGWLEKLYWFITKFVISTDFS